MSEEILVNTVFGETRVAIIEHGLLQELHIEREKRRGLVGNIYKGKVVRVLPGMQAAFVDIGLQRTAFLHSSDLLIGDKQAIPAINTLLSEGQEVVVQVLKDPLGSKGARVTTQISLPSQYLVFIPGYDRIAISKRIANEEEKIRLQQIVASALENGGFIVRTLAEGVAKEALLADISLLISLWRDIQEQISHTKPGHLIYEDLPLALRLIRDLISSKPIRIRIDSIEIYQQVYSFAERFMPNFLPILELYTDAQPLFEYYAVEEEIQKALQKKIPLKSGGHIIIDQTEALTTIDVNTGSFVGKRTPAETLFTTNLEATQAIARQIRLRNLGGMIIVDFIDMDDPEHRRQVINALEHALSRDHVKTTISDISALGLVQMTRKRTRESLAQLLCTACPCCQGQGRVKSLETVGYEIIREIWKEARGFDVKGFLIIAAPVVINWLQLELPKLEASVNKPIRLQSENLYYQQQYDVVLI